MIVIPNLPAEKRAREGPDEACRLAQASARLAPAPERDLQSASVTSADVRSLCRPPSEIRLRDDNHELDVGDGLLLFARYWFSRKRAAKRNDCAACWIVSGIGA